MVLCKEASCSAERKRTKVKYREQGGGRNMAKQPTRGSEKRNTKSRKMRDLPAKSLGADKIASVKGGRKAGESKVDYIEIKMAEILVSGV
jgi:hypothetical protein